MGNCTTPAQYAHVMIFCSYLEEVDGLIQASLCVLFLIPEVVHDWGDGHHEPCLWHNIKEADMIERTIIADDTCRVDVPAKALRVLS